MSNETQPLIQLTCKTKKTEISVYADLLACAGNIVCAARYAGEPEQVQAMAACMSAGGTIFCGEIASFKCKSGQGHIKNVIRNDKYAEGFYCLKDDPIKTCSLQEEGEEEQTAESKRNLYLFCKQEEDLLEELDRKVSVPLLPDFREYFLSELQKSGLLREMTIFSSNLPLCGWYLTVSNDERELVDILNRGLKDGQIQIPGGHPGMTGPLQTISTFTAYLKEFGIQIAEKIKNRFRPVYDPAQDKVCPQILEVNEHVKQNVGYSLFDAQLGTAEAIKRQLERDKLALLIAECGSGKTKIGAAALYAYQHANGDTGKHFNVICCPSHICDKWVREIAETLPNSFAAVVRSITDVNNLYHYYQEQQQDVYCVLSKEQARDGPLLYPTVTWNEIKHGFVCPKCGSVIRRSIDGIFIKVGADFFLHQTSLNHKCHKCGEPLWSVYNPYSNSFNEWVRIGGYGYVHRLFAYRDFERNKDETVRDKIKYILDHPNEYIPTVKGCRKYPLSAYIKRRIPKVDGVIIDELHQYSGESAQGQAMAELAQKADKVIGMTATLLNGYAKGMFYLLFRLKSRLILMDGQTYEKPNNFCSEYGVIEHVTTVSKESHYNVRSKGQKSVTRTRFKPGISPLVYCRFLLENAAFLSLADMGKELPEYEEIPFSCSMPIEVMQVYEKIETGFKSVMKNDMKLANRLMSTYLNLLSAYPDQPYGHDPIPHPLDPKYEPLLDIPDAVSPSEILPKDAKVLELVEKKVRAGERVIIYTAWTRLDTRDKLKNLLTEHGYRVSVLDTNIPARKREKWVDDRVKEGIDVLIVNPALVETGLDLIAFTTLIFYNTAYNLYIFRQASRRSWRINQTAPRVEVYMLYYENTIQEHALSLMASKLLAATAIEGNISEEGLAALSNCDDMLGELARQLVAEIKDEVDDLSASFQKMAILHPSSSKQDDIESTSTPEPVSVQASSIKQTENSVSHFVRNIEPNWDNVIFTIKPKRRQKQVPQNFEETGQVDIMDLLAS